MAIAPTLSAALSLVFRLPSPRRPTRDERARSRPRCATCSTRPSRPTPQSQTDLKAGNLGAYQTDIQTLESNLQEVQQLTGGTVLPSGSTTTTTSTTTP